MNHDESGNRFAVYGKVLDFPEFCLHNWMSNRCGMLKTRCYGVPKVGKVAQELLILCNTECMCVQSNQTTKVQLCQVINVLVFWQEWTLSEQLAYDREIKLTGKNWHRSLIKTLFFFLHWAQGEQPATYQHIPAHSSTKGWILFNTETSFLFLHLNKEFTWMLLAAQAACWCLCHGLHLPVDWRNHPFAPPLLFQESISLATLTPTDESSDRQLTHIIL